MPHDSVHHNRRRAEGEGEMEIERESGHVKMDSHDGEEKKPEGPIWGRPRVKTLDTPCVAVPERQVKKESKKTKATHSNRLVIYSTTQTPPGSDPLFNERWNTRRLKACLGASATLNSKRGETRIYSSLLHWRRRCIVQCPDR